MKHFFSALLILFVVCFCLAPAFATGPGDLMAAHAQELNAPAAPDIVTGVTGAGVTAVVQAAAPLIPGPPGAILFVLAPLLGMLTNVFLRWRKNSKLDDTKRRRELLKDLSFAGVSAATELFARGDSQAQTGDGRFNIAAQHVLRNAGKVVFSTAEIDDQITALMAQIPGVGATGNTFLPKPV